MDIQSISASMMANFDSQSQMDQIQDELQQTIQLQFDTAMNNAQAQATQLDAFFTTSTIQSCN